MNAECGQSSSRLLMVGDTFRVMSRPALEEHPSSSQLIISVEEQKNWSADATRRHRWLAWLSSPVVLCAWNLADVNS